MDTNSIYKNASLVAALYFVSRLLGVLRDRLLAAHFGASSALDVYYGAFRIPDLLFSLLIAGSIGAAFIPLFVEKVHEDEKSGINFAYSFLLVFGAILLILALLGIVTASWWARVVGPGFSPANQAELATLMRILFMSPVLLGVSAIMVAILQSSNIFFSTALGPVVYNLGIIFGIEFFAPQWGARGVVLGVVLGAVLYVAVLLPGMVKVLRRGRPLRFSPSGIGTVLRRMIPMSIGFSSQQIYFWIATSIASFFTAGSVAMFNLANNIYAIPLGLVAISFAAAAFPVFSGLYTKNDIAGLEEAVKKVLLQVSIFAMPMVAMILVARTYLIQTILGAGKFSEQNVEVVGMAVVFFAFAVAADSILTILARAFYAAKNMWTPISVVVGGVVLDVVLGLALWKWLDVVPGAAMWLAHLFGIAGLPDLRMTMLVAGFSLSSLIVDPLLLYFFVRKFKGFAVGEFLRRLVLIVFASCAGAFLGWILLCFAPAATTLGSLHALWWLAISSLVGGVGYVAVLFVVSRVDFMLFLSSLPMLGFVRRIVATPEMETEEPFS